MSDVIALRLDIDSNSYICNTFENTTLQITRTVQSLDSISSAQKVVTEQTFRVPLQGEMIKAIGDLTDPGVTSPIDVRKSISGSILINSFPVFNGSFSIVGITLNPKSKAKEVELVFKGNESSLKSTLAKVKLSELLDEEELDYTISEIKDYYNDPSTYITTNGYTWDLIDYGQDFYAEDGSGTTRIDDDTAPLNQTNFKPCITIQKIFDLIEADQNITLNTDATIDDLMNQVIPLHNNESVLPILDTSPKDYTGFMDRTNNLTIQLSNDTTSGVTTVNFNQVDNYNQTVFNVTTDDYTAQVGGIHYFRFEYDYDISHDATNAVLVSIAFLVYINGVAITPGTISTANLLVNVSATETIAGSRDFPLNLSAGDKVTVRYNITQTSPDTSYTTDYVQQASTTVFECVSTPSFVSTSKVLVGKNIDEDLTCWDVLRTIIAQCNGIVERENSTYTITAWVFWVDNNNEIVNLNEKIDESRDIQIEPTSVTGAKSIRFTYEEGEDLYNVKYKEVIGSQYGELFIPDTGSEFSTEEYEIKIPFTNGVPVLMSGSELTIIKMIDEDGEIIKNTPMLLPRPDYVINQRIVMEDEFGATTYTYNTMPVLSHWVTAAAGGFTGNDLNFGSSLTFFRSAGYPYNTLYERFWRNYIRETYGQESRKYKLSAKIKSAEFTEWDLNEKLILDNAYFRFNSINNYNLSKPEPSDIEIVKRITLINSDIAPYYPVDVIRGVVQWKDSSDNTSVGDGSTEPAADIKTSANAYGFYYDDTNVSAGTGAIAIQLGQLLRI